VEHLPERIAAVYHLPAMRQRPYPRLAGRSRSGGPAWAGDSSRESHLGQSDERHLVFGVEPVTELIAAAPQSVRTLYVRDRDQRRFADEVERVRSSGGETRAVDDATLVRIVGEGSRHQGIAAVVRDYAYAPAEEIIQARPDPLLIIDGVTDPRNLGAILRSAECAGARGVIIARDRTCPITPAAIKSSAGAWAHLQIARCGNVARLLGELKDAGYWIGALTPGGETSLYEVDTGRRLALVIGSEGRGVRQLIAKTADFRVGIPMRGKVNSLNVAVAAAVAMFEIVRRRASTGSRSA
jgi:23S rRNA (guanosine2251-2'-O)-methyltransferase